METWDFPMKHGTFMGFEWEIPWEIPYQWRFYVVSTTHFGGLFHLQVSADLGNVQGLLGLLGLHRLHWWKGLVNSSTDPLSLKSRFIAFIHSIHWSIGPKESLEMLDDFSVKCAAHSHIFDPIHKCFGQPSVYPFLRSLGVGVLAFDAWLSLHCGAFYWRHSNPIPTSSSQFQPSITQKSPPKILELPRPSGGFKEIIWSHGSPGPPSPLGPKEPAAAQRRLASSRQLTAEAFEPRWGRGFPVPWGFGPWDAEIPMAFCRKHGISYEKWDFPMKHGIFLWKMEFSYETWCFYGVWMGNPMGNPMKNPL